MKFVFNVRKAGQAAARLQKAHPELSSAKLAKLLLLADRQSFVETGYPITGGELLSLPAFTASTAKMAWHGPDTEDEYELSAYECRLLDRIIASVDEDVPQVLPEELLRQAGKSEREIKEIAAEVEEYRLRDKAMTATRR